MHISLSGFKRFGIISCLLLAPVLAPQASASAPTSSIKMPKASQSLLLDIKQVDSKIVIVGERGHILTSQDQGESWVQADVPTAQMLTAVSFPNNEEGWAVGHDGNILYTQDGGETWVLQRDGLKAQNEANISAVSIARNKIKELEDKIEKAQTDGEQSEETSVMSDGYGVDKPLSLEEQLEEANYDLQEAEDKLDGPLITPPLMDVWFSDDKNGWATGAFGSLLQTKDGGKTWVDRSKSIDNPDGYHLNSVIGTKDTLYIAGEAGYLIYSKDNGETWKKGDLGYDGTIFGLFAAPDSSFVIATGLRGNTFRTADGGLSWQKLNSNDDYSLFDGAVYENNHIVMVGAGGAISVSLDGGETFKRYTLPTRSALSAVLPLGGSQFMMVGQGGVHRFDLNSAAK